MQGVVTPAQSWQHHFSRMLREVNSLAQRRKLYYKATMRSTIANEGDDAVIRVLAPGTSSRTSNSQDFWYRASIHGGGCTRSSSPHNARVIKLQQGHTP